MRREFEFKLYEELGKITIRDKSFDVELRDYKLVSADRLSKEDAEYSEDLELSPCCIKIKGLRRVAKITSFYVRELLKQLEMNEGVTGINVIYDPKTDTIRPFAFVSFVSWEAANGSIGQTFTVFQETIQSEEARKVPVVVTPFNRLILDDNIKHKYSETLHRANILCTALIEATPPPTIERSEERKEGTQAMDDDMPTDDSDSDSEALVIDLEENFEL